MSVKDAFKGGLELKFFAQQEFESIENVPKSEQAPVIARNALRFLMMGWTDSWPQLATSSVIYSVLVRRNPALLKELRFAFQQGFEQVFEQLNNQELTKEQNEQVQLYLSNCLTLLPYSDLTAYESIKVPQYIDDHWEFVEYQVTPIELTDFSGFKRYVSRDKDRVFAYGLEPLFQKQAESHLIFMGTTYPAGQGFLTQVKTDSKGFETVGKSLYRSGRARVQKWLSKQDNKIHVCGVSLGGSLSLLLAIDQGDYELSRVDALNPAGLHDAKSKSRYDKWEDLDDRPRVIVQKQGNDPVSIFGIWKDDWDIIEVQPPEEKQGTNSLYDHFLNYAGFADTTFTYVDATEDNDKRKARNFWIYSLGRGLLYYSIVLPYTYIVRPAAYFVAENWMLVGTVAALIVVTGLATAGIVPAYFFVSAGIALLATACLLTIPFIFNEEQPKTAKEQAVDELAEMHKPDLPRNAEMDLYHEDNSVEIDLSFGDINTYYQATRSLLKGKKFLPDEEKPSKHMEGVSKRALLEAAQDPEKADTVIPFKTTKAKAAHIYHTLSLVHQLGEENRAELKSELQQNDLEYQVGKHPG